MFITGIGIAVPERRFTQAECWAAACDHAVFRSLPPRSQALVKKVLLGNNGISTRHVAVDSIQEMFNITPDALHTRFTKHAPVLAANAGRRALASCATAVDNVDAIIISTCTGYLCPGLTSYVIEDLGLRADVVALDLVGQGCGAALPNLSTAQALLAAGHAKIVLSVCVEVCSAAFYLDDDPGVLISNCLFGDAAGALVLSNDPGNLRGPVDGPATAITPRTVEWKTSASTIDPKARDLLRFEQRRGMLRNVLTPQVPALAAEKAEQLLRRVLQSAGVHKKEVAAWIVHAGGRDVLSAIGERFALPRDALGWSAEVLNELGNVSSPFVIHVLERALWNGPAGYWWMTSFGAGFSCHGALLEVR
jgi:predicted naringenin-chalcone synthase